MISFSPLLALTAPLVQATQERTTWYHGSRPDGIAIHVNISREYQVFDGMGFSQAFQRGNIIYGSDGLSKANTAKVLDLLFSNSTGAGLTILRNGIGSSATAPYDLMKSIAPTNPGSALAKLNYTFDGDDNGQIRLSRDAISRGLRTIYADAWSAPGYMKNNSDDSRGGFLCGVTGVECPSGDWKQSYADYLVQYVKFYREAGIHIDYVGFLNEPDLNVTYASMLSSGQQAADFLKVFHPALKASGLNTSIACCDGGGWEEGRRQLDGVKEAGAEDMLNVATAHGYITRPSTPFKTSKRVWQTEWADLDGPSTLAWYNNGSSGEGLTWALNIQQAFQTSNVSAFLYWIGAGNTTTNSALIQLHKDDIKVSKRLWAFAQYSRFVKPGATRIHSSISDNVTMLSSSAFKNTDGSVAVQVINNGSTDACANVKGLDAKERSMRMYLTSDEFDLVKMNFLSKDEDDCSLIPARSMVSFVLSKKFGLL